MTRATQALAEINVILQKYDLCLMPTKSYDEAEIYISDGYDPCVADDCTEEAKHEKHICDLRRKFENRHQTNPWRRRADALAAVCEALVRVYTDRGLLARPSVRSRRVEYDRRERTLGRVTAPAVQAARDRLRLENPELYKELFGERAPGAR